MITPTREEFRQRARKGNVVAVVRDVLADMLTPVAAFRRLAAGGVPSFILESVVHGDQIGRYSFLGANPRVMLRAKGDTATITRYSPDEITIQATTDAPGLLVLSETWDAGWQATVNGAEATVYRANHTLRAVAIRAGTSG